MTIEYQTALDIFESLQRQFPNLKMKLGREPKEVDLELLIPAQSGLDFPIELNLQNRDELHLVADVFWCEWFPLLIRKKYQNLLQLLLVLFREAIELKFINEGASRSRQFSNSPTGTDGLP